MNLLQLAKVEKQSAEFFVLVRVMTSKEEETNATTRNGGAGNPVFTLEQEAWLQRFFSS